MSFLIYINIILCIIILILLYCLPTNLLNNKEYFTSQLPNKNKLVGMIENFIQTTSSTNVKNIIIGYWNKSIFSSDTRSKCFDCDKAMPEKSHGYSCFDCEEGDKKVFRHTLE